MKNLLIIGYGKWGKKIFNFLKKKNLFNTIYIKQTNKTYVYNNKKNQLNKINNNYLPKNINFVHICSQVETHYSLYKKYKKIKYLSIEKPLFNKWSQYNTFNDQYSINVNYVDLYNPVIENFFKNLKFSQTKQIYLNYSARNNFYKKQIDFLNDWLDHPLSILLQMQKIDKIEEFNSEIKVLNNKKFNYFFIKLRIEKLLINISINNTINKKREFIILKKNKKIKYDLLKNRIFINNKLKKEFKYSSFEIFFSNLGISKKNIKFKKIKFHKKIFKFKSKLINLVKKGEKYSKIGCGARI
tara:strand:+ start:112 stop:1008 length:897 start_codon:yes stop_codon:yes gene_type:complete